MHFTITFKFLSLNRVGGIGGQLLKEPLVAAISAIAISPNPCKDRAPHRELLALLITN